MNIDALCVNWIDSLMLAAAAAPAAAAAGKLTPNWFDLIVGVILILGLVIGRRRGMSLELLDVFQWLLMVVLASIYYERLGNWIAYKSDLELLYSYLIAYGSICVVVKMLFTTIKVKAGEKVVGSDVFGSMEYYLGMVAGMTRFFCMLLIALSLMNASVINEAEIAKKKKAQEKELGSSFFPQPGEIQKDILVSSISGPLIRKIFEDQMIAPTPAGTKFKQGEPPSARKHWRDQNKLGGTNTAATNTSAATATNAPAGTNAAPRK